MDRCAARSHQLAAKATDEGRLAEEIVTVTVKRKKDEVEVDADEAIRPETTVEVLAKLRAVGGDDATHTAGNAPGVNDGAGAVVVASEEWAKREGGTPIARVLSYGAVADDFAYLARTPAKAAKQALEKVGKSPEEVDLWEINEAFASVAINSVRMLGDRRREGERERRRDRTRPPDRGLGSADRRRADPRASPPRRRPGMRRDLLRWWSGRRDRARGERRLAGIGAVLQGQAAELAWARGRESRCSGPRKRLVQAENPVSRSAGAGGSEGARSPFAPFRAFSGPTSSAPSRELAASRRPRTSV